VKLKVLQGSTKLVTLHQTFIVMQCHFMSKVIYVNYVLILKTIKMTVEMTKKLEKFMKICKKLPIHQNHQKLAKIFYYCSHFFKNVSLSNL